MHRTRKYIAALCAVLLLAGCVMGLLGAAAARQAQVYFMAVNETILDLNAETMPMMTNRRVYVPYTMFDPNTTGVDLGVYTSYGNSTLMIYSRSAGALIFDLANDTVTSSLGDDFSSTAEGSVPRAIIRNSTVFVPVDLVCDYFGLEWSLPVLPEYGFVVRVRSSASVLDNETFMPAAENSFRARYNAYLRSLEQNEPQPTTGPGDSGQSEPSASVSPAPEGAEIYLAFRCTQGDGLAQIQTALAEYQAFGLFFFRPEELAGQDDAIRALAAAGHRIGLLLDGTEASQAELGNQMLRHILRTEVSTALLETGAEAPEGWVTWTTTVDGLPGDRSASRQARDIVRATQGEDVCFVLLDDSAQSAEALEQALPELSDDGCQFRLAVETVLD